MDGVGRIRRKGQPVPFKTITQNIPFKQNKLNILSLIRTKLVKIGQTDEAG